MRTELIVDEMAGAVRVLGGEGSAKQQNSRAARAASLPVALIERLRWKKIKRVPADVADAIREALTRYNEESLRRARHEIHLAQVQNAEIAEELAAVDPVRFRAEIHRLRQPLAAARNETDLAGKA